MSWIAVDHDLCERDGECMAVCSRKLIVADADGYPVSVADGEAVCLRCGHCLSTCPHGALELRGVAPDECAPVDSDGALGEEAVRSLLMGRRSVRDFRERAVPRETIEWLLQTTRWAPSASNKQPVHWLVIDGREKVRELAVLMAEFLRGRPGFEMHMAAWDEGRDYLLRSAPHLVIAHAVEEGPFTVVDCTIAVTELDLAARALGLGGCWAGLFMAAASAHPPLQETLGLPEGHKVFAALMLGEPTFQHHRLPPRNELRVTWR
jgi:nitroreductase/NAD-dependent dihydropyrimidine dehydrogenase PreA subunit